MKAPKEKIEFKDEVVLITTRTLHNLFQYKEGSDAAGLYNFYQYTAKWQKTNRIKATDDYCRKGLSWGKARFKKAKKILLAEKLIEVVHTRKDGKITGWYIQVNYIWRKEKTELVESILMKKEIEDNQKTQNKQVDSTDSDSKPSNASSANNGNALGANKSDPASGVRLLKKRKISKDNGNPQIQELIDYFDAKSKYGCSDRIIYTDEGKEIDQNRAMTRHLLRKYPMETIKNVIDFYSEESRLPPEKRNYLPLVGNIYDLYYKIDKLIDYFEARGLNYHTGKRFANLLPSEKRLTVSEQWDLNLRLRQEAKKTKIDDS